MWTGFFVGVDFKNEQRIVFPRKLLNLLGFRKQQTYYTIMQQFIDTYDFAGKKAIVRVDFNVPLTQASTYPQPQLSDPQ